MAKNKKTKEQKIISDLRRKLYLQKQTISNSKDTEEKLSSSNNVQIPQPSISYTHTIRQNTEVINHTYLYHDLLRTTILTSAIVIGQVILFFLLKNHIINLPLANF